MPKGAKLEKLFNRISKNASHQSRQDGIFKAAGRKKVLPGQMRSKTRNGRAEFDRDAYLAKASIYESQHQDRRLRALESDQFAMILQQRLGQTAKETEDEKYAGFLLNLQAFLQDPSVRSALLKSTELSPSTDGQAWMPKQQTKPMVLFHSLKLAYYQKGLAAIDSQLKYAYVGLLAFKDDANIGQEARKGLLDLRYPAEWYPSARGTKRVIHLHVGPTNSGKTFHALKALEKARTGVYASPLRLLAHEVYARMNSLGQVCDLVTGDEQIRQTSGTASIKSCTVEMVPLGSRFDVAVIDEIQMIGDEFRGWAWTQAFLGLNAKEIHLCGEERALPLIRHLTAQIGDVLEVHTYKRLSPLKMMSTSLKGDLKNLRKGDCLVVFSRVKIHALKQQIETATNRRVAIVYGGLPPDIRSQQARLFNDSQNDYDYLVASDAIGMGLNLAIKRIVFESVRKYQQESDSIELIPINQIKQIAGRAGRFRTAPQSVEDASAGMSEANGLADQDKNPDAGLVTTLEQSDLQWVREAMETPNPPLQTAGLLPPSDVTIRFANYFAPSINFGYVLLRLQELALKHPKFHFCNLGDQLHIADATQPVRGLSIRERLLFGFAPVSGNDARLKKVARALATCLGDNTSGELLSIPELDLEALDEPETLQAEYVDRLESLHKSLILYIWLSYRFAGCFVDQDVAFYAKKLVEHKIDSVLLRFSASQDTKTRNLGEKTAAGHLYEEGVPKPNYASLRFNTSSREELNENP